ncbi:hypothetical protein ACFV4P_34990 [Kitasatospora sp. NPDC059795]|uniref:hypothetical protein n=1 Tax=Kitasatospora sp. NPDC059795 TaxID=3346949 RepID=UPI0036542CF6
MPAPRRSHPPRPRGLRRQALSRPGLRPQPRHLHRSAHDTKNCACGETATDEWFVPGRDQKSLRERVARIGAVYEFGQWFDRTRPRHSGAAAPAGQPHPRVRVHGFGGHRRGAPLPPDRLPDLRPTAEAEA